MIGGSAALKPLRAMEVEFSELPPKRQCSPITRIAAVGAIPFTAAQAQARCPQAAVVWVNTRAHPQGAFVHRDGTPRELPCPAGPGCCARRRRDAHPAVCGSTAPP